MTLSAAIALLLAVLVWFLIRYTKLRAWQAIICMLLGFFVAATPVAPYVRSACTAVVHLISGLVL